MSPLVYVASASRKQVATSYSCVLTAPRPLYGTINACYASQLPRLLETQPYGYVYNNSRLETADVLANGFLQRFIESVGQSKSMFVRDCYNGTGNEMRYGGVGLEQIIAVLCPEPLRLLNSNTYCAKLESSWALTEPVRNHGLKSRRRVAMSFLFSFKGLASTIAVMGCFFFTCSFLLNVHVGSSTPTDHEVLGLKQYERNGGRHPLSLTSNALKAQLKETVRSVVDYQGLVLMHGSIARKLKLENSKLARNFAEISINFTDLIKKASHCDVSDSNTALVHRFLKQAKEKVKFAKQLISNSKGSFDSQLKIQKLKDTIFGLEEQMTKMKTKGEFAKSIAAKAIPRNLHCLALRLMQERIENPIRYINKQTKSRQPRQEFEDPNLYHYAIFSDNVLAASVVVNSVVQNAKEPWKHVLHIVTERTTLAAMKVMFKLKDHNGTHIEVKAVEDYKFLNSSYVPVLRQQESAELLGYYYGNGLENSTTGSSNLKFRNPKYLSMLNHLRFYLPEMYPKLHKILFLDDDVVVQKDLTGLWEIDMDGKVNGAVETCFGSFHRYDKYLKFDHPLIKETFDPKACAWAYGMNIFDLDAWRRDNCTEKYHYWQELNGNRTLWRLGTLPPGLITFYSTTKPLDKSWHVLGLGYNPGLSEEKIQNAAVIHYNGDSKPWLATAIPRYQPLWTKHVDYDLEFFRACNFAP
ncbi:hypothetical protein Peur_043715 [Populus x canadensis]